MALELSKLEEKPSVQEARLYKAHRNGAVKCGVCERRCVIHQRTRGYCGARMNIDGKLFVLTYGDISSISANPIEKKPFHHFHPGTHALTIGGWGCNAGCPWCQNWSISKRRPNPRNSSYISPTQFIQAVRDRSCQGTSFSFNEPTTVFFEYSLDVMPKAHEMGYYNTYVTNGYMTSVALARLAAAGLDAMNIDIKGCRAAVRKFCGLNVEKVWRNAKQALDLGIWVEITTLVIPGMNDTSRCLSSIARRIRNDLGAEVPWHVSAFYPAYQATKYGLTQPTPIITLERALALGRKAGLNFVYIGNVPGHPAENSYCKSCGSILVRRVGYDITLVHLTLDGRCDQCDTPNPFVIAPRYS